MDMAYVGSRRRYYEILRNQLETEQATFWSHWRDIAENALPRRIRLTTSDANRGDKRNQKILDGTATLAARVLKAGMMSGMSSPSRPWFKLSTPDPGLQEDPEVKFWLEVVTKRMATVFLRSNLYNCLPILYGDVGVFGTGAMLVEEDFQNVIRCQVFPLGSYYVSNNRRGKVDTFLRKFRMTVRQMVDQFGLKEADGQVHDWSNFSTNLKSLWDRGQYETWIDVSHVIEPNYEFDPRKQSAKNKRFRSVYYEQGVGSYGGAGSLISYEDDLLLRESGYDYFPVLCIRWETSGEDVYGTSCPGMDALGDIKQLQLGEKRSLQAIEKMVNPPVVGPQELSNKRVSTLPGGYTWVDERGDSKGFRPAYQVDPKTRDIEYKQEKCRERINEFFLKNLFTALIDDDRRQPATALEISERQKEKLQIVGPVLEQFNQDGFDPLIGIAYAIMDRQGLIPPPPDVLQGAPRMVEYVSILAQAQKLLGLAGIDRFSQYVGNILAQTGDHAVLDAIDVDKLIRIYADLTSVPIDILRATEVVNKIRQQRAQAMQAQQTAQMANQASVAAKNFSRADLSGNNALTALLEQAKAGQLTPAA